MPKSSFAAKRKSTRREYTSNRKSKPIDDTSVTLFGIHAVEAALKNPNRVVTRLMLTANAEQRLAETLKGRNIAIERIIPKKLDKLLGEDTVHQGAALDTEHLPEPSLEDLAEAAHQNGPIVVLDHVTDPHNVGAVLRSCAVFGASGLIMTRRHSPPLTGTLAKSASGAVELVPIHLASNLATTLIKLKESDLCIVGLSGEGASAVEDETFNEPMAIVLGAEGKGLRQLTAATCDKLCRITTAGSLASLNVSNAAAVTLHFAALQRRRHAAIATAR